MRKTVAHTDPDCQLLLDPAFDGIRAAFAGIEGGFIDRVHPLLQASQWRLLRTLQRFSASLVIFITSPEGKS
jgi:hypothetical protein